VEPSIPASVVIQVLEWLFLTRGVPEYLHRDNGPEFVSNAVCQWLNEAGCSTLFIEPGSPWENGYIESFNDKLRDECLNREIFRNGREAQVIVEAFRQESITTDRTARWATWHQQNPPEDITRRTR
jgi:transposase InsO family protein